MYVQMNSASKPLLIFAYISTFDNILIPPNHNHTVSMIDTHEISNNCSLQLQFSTFKCWTNANIAYDLHAVDGENILQSL